MEIKLKKLYPDAIIPTYGSKGAAAFDLYALNDVTGVGRVIVPLGIAVEIPENFVMIIKSRSGLAFRDKEHAFSGVIDSDYRGEIKVLLMSENTKQTIIVSKSQRIAQAIIMPVIRNTFKEVSELSDTLRGTGGFGSTNK